MGTCDSATRSTVGSSLERIITWMPNIYKVSKMRCTEDRRAIRLRRHLQAIATTISLQPRASSHSNSTLSIQISLSSRAVQRQRCSQLTVLSQRTEMDLISRSSTCSTTSSDCLVRTTCRTQMRTRHLSAASPATCRQRRDRRPS